MRRRARGNSLFEPLAEAHAKATAVLVDKPKPIWVCFVDRRLEAGPPKRAAPTLAFLVADARAAAPRDRRRSRR
jgi:hypothetical protein